MAVDPRWEEAHASEDLGRYPPEYLIRWVNRYLPRGEARGSTRLLDLGCGQGAGTWYLAREGFQVDGVDASPSAVEKTRSRVMSDKLHDFADVFLSDAAHLPYKDGVIDGAVDSLCSCHHQPTQGLFVIKELARVMRRGAWLLSAWPSTWSWQKPFTDRGQVTFMDPPYMAEVFKNDLFYMDQVDQYSYTLGADPPVHLWVVSARRI